MGYLDLWDVFAVLIAVAGPAKVVLSFAHLCGEQSPRALRRLAFRATGAAALCGTVVALTADPLLHLFHIERSGVMVAGGAILFVYALRLVLEGHADTTGSLDEVGFGALLLPYIASPLAMTSVIVVSVLRGGWLWPLIVAFAYLVVTAINLGVMLVLTYAAHRIPHTWVQIGGRLLGLLLAAVGAELLIDGLNMMGLIKLPTHR